ncbi:MAG: serine/threonine-protein kinase [Pirellula sp.]|nr:serine/threonine-protein kinase [Pirellula sp.]
MNPDEFAKDIETKSLAPTANEPGKDETATQFFDEMSWGAKTSIDDTQGTQIGKYTLLEKLGEGGFGTVWRAEQRQPVQREVAVKILKLGMDSREIVARFAQERQALAIMEHPGIAKVLDAGVSDTGRPYFVMELVRGVPLSQFCNSERLDTQDRIRLFIQVCKAVHHAHLKGIIHRDLKPGNILVTKSDAGIQPKVIDFGIAKATTNILPDMSMQTRVGQFMGTPAYMSPEQAEGLVDDLDMRSDVYSLGAVLYEIMTGELPFYASGEARLSYDELRRRICEQVPQKPSTRLRAMKDDRLQKLADQRATDTKRIVSTLRGDLDWIVMKALEKDRERRYDTAHDLAEDLDRHLSNRPVLACPPSTSYVVRRFVARNRLAVASASMIAATMIGALILSTTLFFNEQRARKEADNQSIRSKEMVTILKDMILAAGPSVAQGRDTSLMKDILAATAKRIETQFADKPELELEVRQLLSQAYQDIGEFQLGHAMQSRVLELTKQVHSDQPEKIADAMLNQSMALEAIDELSQAEALVREAIEMRLKIHPIPWHRIAQDRELLAWILVRQGDFVAAEVEARKSLTEYPSDVDGAAKFRSQALMTLGTNLMKTAQFTEGESVHREALQIYRDLFDKPHPMVVTALNNMCHMLCEVGKFDEVEMLAKEALELQELLDGTPIGVCTDSLNKALAVVHFHRGNHDQAIACLKTAIDAATKVYGADHRFTNDKRSLLAQYLLEVNRLDEATAVLEEAKRVGGDGKSADNSLGVAQAKLELARGNLQEAERIAREDLEARKKESLQPSIIQVEAIQTLAAIYARQGHIDSAKKLLHEAISILRPSENPTSVMLKGVQRDLEKLEKEKLDKPST